MEDKKLKKLSDTEKFVLKVIFDEKRPVTCTEVIDILNRKYGKKYADTTVYTFLKNIRIKGYISIYRKNVNYYEPCIDRDAFVKSEINNILMLWFDNDKEKMKKFIDMI